MSSDYDGPDRPRANIAQGERLARQLCRLLAPRRFGSMVLWFRGGCRVNVNEPGDVQVRLSTGTIETAIRGEMQEMLFENLLAIEYRPRSAVPAKVPQHDRPKT